MILTVPSEFHGVRLDIFLTSALEGVSRSALKKSLERVLVNRKVAALSRLCREGEVVEVFLKEQSVSPVFFDETLFATVVYEDEHLMVVNKKEGQLVFPPRENEMTYCRYILSRLGDPSSSFPDPRRAGIVHRLDRGTAGALLLAKTVFAYEKLVKDFKRQAVYKEYRALVKGVIYQSEDVIQLPIARAKRFNRRRIDQESASAKEAVTEYEVLLRLQEAEATYLRIILHTGRTHQIRLHFAHLGYPVLGDTMYNRNMFSHSHLYLFASYIGFVHPVTKKQIEFSLPVPDYFRSYIGDFEEEARDIRIFEE